MTDWKALALARGIPAVDIDRIVAPLTALETAFHPLAQALAPANEPAAIYRPEEDASPEEDPE